MKTQTQSATTPIYTTFSPKSTALKKALNGFGDEPLKPDFHPGEQLNSTPPILQSLSCHGPQTFICVPSSGCPTFVIPSTENMNGTQQEFLSYVIEPKKVAQTEEVKEEVDSRGEEVEKLKSALDQVRLELKAKDAEVGKLTRIREDGERELEDLTASLFQEAHRMVREANEKAAASEKALTESQMKVDVLTAEVTALKTLVLTSTPSRPNPHLHPQIGSEPSTGGNLFSRRHRRSPSHFNLKYGRENSPPDSPVKHDVALSSSLLLSTDTPAEVDPGFHRDVMSWREQPKFDKTHPFIAKVYAEDIDLCFDFNNRELADEVRLAAEKQDIFIEAVTDQTKTAFPKKCALLQVSRICHYRMKLGDRETWYSISQICRNRIIAVCDFLNYLRYIELGLVKSTPHDIYWEIVRLRKEMALARLGLSMSST